MAHSWRKLFCAVIIGCLGKSMAQNKRAMMLFSTAHSWRTPCFPASRSLALMTQERGYRRKKGQQKSNTSEVGS